MAILKSLPGVEVTVEVDGEPLDECEVKTSTDKSEANLEAAFLPAGVSTSLLSAIGLMSMPGPQCRSDSEAGCTRLGKG